MRLAGLTAAALLLIGASCGDATSPNPSPAPSPVTGPRAVMPSGAVYGLEVVITPEEQARGLMFRESLRERTGMLFPYWDARPHSFWMKNTMIPLDIVWMDRTGRVVFLSANTPPCKADPCPGYGPGVPVWYVLEIAGGMAEKEKVTVGSRIRFFDIPGEPPPGEAPPARSQ